MFLRKHWIGLTVFLLAIVGIGLYYLAIQPPPEPIVIYKAVEPLEKPTQHPQTETPVVAETQGGHTHADGIWHAEPEKSLVDSTTEPFSEPVRPVAEDAIPAPPQKQYTKNSGNPLMFKGFPVDLSDFEATKASMIENVNFVKANWDPNVFNREVRTARIYVTNISSYVDSILCFYTPDQREEIRALRFSLLDFFKGIDSK